MLLLADFLQIVCFQQLFVALAKCSQSAREIFSDKTLWHSNERYLDADDDD